jgi:hypothetical protein
MKRLRARARLDVTLKVAEHDGLNVRVHQESYLDLVLELGIANYGERAAEHAVVKRARP